jgi:septal ring factor EnvC (AmiA/AmiB activator)
VTDDLSSLIPGGSMVAAALGLLGWFVKNARDTQAEWRDLLKTERADRVRDLADERDRHERAIAGEHERGEKVKAAHDTIETDLRRRLADAETAEAGWKDEAADAQRRAAHWRAEYTRLTGSAPDGRPAGDEMPDPYGKPRRGGY